MRGSLVKKHRRFIKALMRFNRVEAVEKGQGNYYRDRWQYRPVLVGVETDSKGVSTPVLENRPVLVARVLSINTVKKQVSILKTKYNLIARK